MKNVYSYYEPEQDAKLDNLIQFHGPSCYPSHFHRKIEITYVLKGSMNARVNEKDYHSDADDILFVPTFYAHSYATSDDAMRLIFLPHQSLCENFLSAMGKRSFASISFNDKSYNKNVLLPLLLDLTKLDDNDSLLTRQGLVTVVFGRMLEHYPTIPSEKNKLDTLVNILTYIDDHFTENLTLDSLAGQFGYSPYHFSKMFNAHVGCNLRNYINNLRIHLFVRSYHKNDNIMHLAYNVGFNSMPSFYRAFEEVHHCSPKDFF